MNNLTVSRNQSHGIFTLPTLCKGYNTTIIARLTLLPLCPAKAAVGEAEAYRLNGYNVNVSATPNNQKPQIIQPGRT
jgi:hypothetical protein